MIASEVIVIQCLIDDADELFALVVGVELLDVHEAGVVLDGEPSATLANLGTPYVARIPSWRFTSCAIVLPQAVFTEGLREVYIHQFPVGLVAEGYR